jgi:hypothetical protein
VWENGGVMISWNNSEKALFKCHLIYNKSDKKLLGAEPEDLRQIYNGHIGDLHVQRLCKW